MNTPVSTRLDRIVDVDSEDERAVTLSLVVTRVFRTETGVIGTYMVR